MMVRGEPVAAETSFAWGLADVVATAGSLEEALRDFIAPILAQSRAVVCGFKAQALAARRGAPYDERRALERDVFVDTWTSAEHWAAVDALLNRQRGG
jgi:enoyl-CoA hydratase/carnithine racemase